MKTFTDLEQSKKLAEILSLESADRVWEYQKDRFVGETDYLNNPQFGCVIDKRDVACWSLAALLATLPDYTLQTNTDGTVFVVCESRKPMISDAYDNPIDACYEMILKLHELKML